MKDRAPKVSGFTLIRNGVQFDYPFLESWKSLLPLVDELVINVGRGDDQTLEQAKGFATLVGYEKVKVFESTWPLDDPVKKKSGLILSEQTNLALERCQNDWCFYLQADEVLHEDDYDRITHALRLASQSDGIDGILFDYQHFYGSFDVVQKTRSAYRREVRLIRKSSGARSVGDAQSFRLPGGDKPRVKRSGASIYHYGWVRTPEAMKEKTYFMDQLYHGSPSPEQKATRTPHSGSNYRYKRFWGLVPFEGTHPAVMRERVEKLGWHWDLKSSPFVWKYTDVKKILLDGFEKLTGIRLFEYRSYKLD